MLQEKTDKYFLKYRHDEHTSHLTGKNKNMGLEVTDRKLKGSPIRILPYFTSQLYRLNELKKHSGFHVLKPLFRHYSWFTAVKYLSIVVAFFIAFFIFRSASGSRYSQ